MQIQLAPDTQSVRRSTKYHQIVEAAANTFLTMGYAAASMDRIAQEAGVSKITIYKYFPGKEALFSEIVLQMCDDFMKLITKQQNSSQSPEMVLREFAKQILETIQNDRVMGLYRLVIAETPKFPELGSTFYAIVFEHAITPLASWLETKTRQGLLQIDHPRLAAEVFFSLVSASLRSKRMLMPNAVIDEAEYNEHAELAITIFMNSFMKKQ